MNLRLHSLLPCSRANGPGTRAVVWVQGCSLGCPGCFNPETHTVQGAESVAVDDLLQRIVGLGDSIEGITISGGEPLQQRPAVVELLRRVKAETALSVILFTGFRWEEVVGASERESDQALWRDDAGAFHQANDLAHGKRFHAPTPSRSAAPRHPDTSRPRDFLNYMDVLIAGRYDAGQRVARGLRGSANKTVHFITDRYTAEDLEAVPPAEVLVSPRGELIISGIQPVAW
ncbi:MAG: radical SAM protein [Verrucomicrobia bacterium]|nr:radical SAM protein [Verrucomicrobiota bacterium]